METLEHILVETTQTVLSVRSCPMRQIIGSVYSVTKLLPEWNELSSGFVWTEWRSDHQSLISCWLYTSRWLNFKQRSFNDALTKRDNIFTSRNHLLDSILDASIQWRESVVAGKWRASRLDNKLSGLGPTLAPTPTWLETLKKLHALQNIPKVRLQIGVEAFVLRVAWLHIYRTRRVGQNVGR